MRKYTWMVGPLLLLLFSVHPGQGPVFETADATGGSGDTLRYVFLGHIYSWKTDGKRVDARVLGLDYDRFDRIFLGGDICSEAFQYESTVQHIDSAFDLRAATTHYALGNHDARNENIEWYEAYTGRKPYYVTAAPGMTIVTLNTTLNAGDCENLDAQFRMLKSVTDTIQSASHLMILQHHTTWRALPGMADAWSWSNWPYYEWDANCYEDSTKYLQAIYPLLVDVKNRGVEVVTVIGDAGVTNKGSEMVSTDGLHYLASGINNSKFFGDSLALDSALKDKVLIFEHCPDQGTLNWDFHDLDSLFDAHQ